MHLNMSISLLFALLSIYSTSSALPFILQRNASSKSLAARATYSVVPIDGSPDGSGSGATETIVVTPSPTTRTVVESSPPVTNTIVVTAQPATQTISTTVSVIDIRSTIDIVTTTVTEDDDAPTSTLTYPSVEPTITASAYSTTSSIPTTTAQSSVRATSASLTETLPHSIIIISPTTVASVPVSSWSWSSSHDDGYWHTSYPSWNGTVSRRFVREH
ncbi:hypothetical protein F4819DRAFT_468207 [Hypoxylon fuscum]|nr:hypothetical protein F4819DRAFT_468207 [Hypoxylon fuscum]